MRRFLQCSATLVLCLGFAAHTLSAQDDCAAIVQAALDTTAQNCETTGRNQACYGNVNLEAESQPDVEDFEFGAPGDIEEVSALQSLTLSSQIPEQGQWGVALMQLQANLPDSELQNITFILFGEVAMRDGGEGNDSLQPMQAFYFTSGEGDAPCEEAPDSGILIQTPEGVGEISLLVNEVDIQLGSTAYLQAQADGEMTASVVEGEATITAGGVTVTVPEGNQVTVPLDAQGVADGAPTDPQPYDAAKMAVLPIRLLPRAITIAGGSAIIPAAGEWQWTNGTPSQEGCPAGAVQFVVPTFTPKGTFQLPGDEFDLVILLNAAFSASGPPPNAEFSNPDPNTYVVDFSDSGLDGHYEVTVIDSQHIEGQMGAASQGCTMAIPFEVILVGAESVSGSIIPAAGEWKWVWDTPTAEGCPPGEAEFAAEELIPIGTFRLPDGEFSVDMLLEASFQPPLPNSSQSGPNTYTAERMIGNEGSRYLVEVIDSEHITGQYVTILRGCTVTEPFTVTRIGD